MYNYHPDGGNVKLQLLQYCYTATLPYIKQIDQNNENQ